MFCVGTIHIVEVHTELENAKTEYAVALGEYNQAYGYWETAERQVRKVSVGIVLPTERY